MFLWDIAPWMRQTTVQLNDIIHRIEEMQADIYVLINMVAQNTSELTPEDQRTINAIYERSVATRAKMEAAMKKGKDNA